MGCCLYGGAGNLLTFVSFVIKTQGCGLFAVQVIARKIRYIKKASIYDTLMIQYCINL